MSNSQSAVGMFLLLSFFIALCLGTIWLFAWLSQLDWSWVAQVPAYVISLILCGAVVVAAWKNIVTRW